MVRLMRSTNFLGRGMREEVLNGLGFADCCSRSKWSLIIIRVSEYIYAEFEWSLKGKIMGARDQDPKHIDSFFPESNDSLKDSGWDAVLRWGYLKSFFPQKGRMSRHDFIDLRWDLGRILNRLQCLPMAGVTKGYCEGSIWMKGKKRFQIWVNPNHYHLKKTLVLKGSRRSRMKKGLKSIPQQAKDFANI